MNIELNSMHYATIMACLTTTADQLEQLDEDDNITQAQAAILAEVEETIRYLESEGE